MRWLVFALLAWSLTSGPARAEEITIAVVGPLTGASAGMGEELQRGASAAVKEINANGGIGGRPLKLIAADDACDPIQAIAAAREAIDRGAQTIIGHYCSGASIPASDIYNKANLLQISPASTNPALTERGLDNVYRVCGRDEGQASAAADFLARNFTGKPIAVVDDKSVFGKWVADRTADNLRAAGIKELLRQQIDPGQESYASLIQQLKKITAAAIYFGGYQREAGLIVREARDAGLDTQLVSGDALTTKDFWQTAGPAGEGVVFTSNPDPRDDPAAATIVAAFRRQHYDPEGYTLYTYAAVQVFAAAARQAKSLALADLNRVLRSQTFHTVVGDIAFDGKGDRAAFRYGLFKWHNGNYSPL